MTNHNALVAGEPESDIAVAITVAMSSSSSPELPRSLAPASGLFSISRKRSFKRPHNGGGGAKIGGWIASPTSVHEAPRPSLSETNDHEQTSSWMVRHPSALGRFKEITSASKGKQIVMFLDYDGTLSPIVEDPDRAFMPREMRAAVRDVSKYFPTAIVSGRCRDKVYGFVKLAELYYAGSHGMDIKGPTNAHKYNKLSCKASQKAVNFQPATEFLPMIDEVHRALAEKTKSIPGAKVENNKYCVSVHFRCVEEKKWKALAEDVRSVISQYPRLKLTHGRKVLEIRPTIKWDKGRALEFLLESLGYGNSRDVLPLYIGDDQTDEDAFKALRKKEQGFGILVSKVPKETSAPYSLQEPSEVMNFLQRLVRWKRSELQQ